MLQGAGTRGPRPGPVLSGLQSAGCGRGTKAAPPRPSRPRPARGGGPPRVRRGSSAPAGAAAGAARGGAARAARSGPARPGATAAAAAAAATPEPVGAFRKAAAGAWPQRGKPRGPEPVAAAMPLLFLERFPWPSLRTYTGLSGLALLGTIVSAYRALSQPEDGSGEPEPLTAPLQPEARLTAGGPRARDVAQYLLSDSLFVWVSEAAGRARGRAAGREPPCHPLSAGGRGRALTPASSARGPRPSRGARGPAALRAWRAAERRCRDAGENSRGKGGRTRGLQGGGVRRPEAVRSRDTSGLARRCWGRLADEEKAEVRGTFYSSPDNFEMVLFVNALVPMGAI